MAYAPFRQTRFASRHELRSYAGEWSIEQGFCVTTGKSNGRHIEVKCDLGGVYRARNVRGVGRTSSRLCLCPFLISGLKRADGFWYMSIRNGTHNHEVTPDDELVGHSQARLLNKAQEDRIEELSSSGVKPRQIESSLRQQYPNILITRQDILNSIYKAKTRRLDGLSPIECLANKLETESDWIFELSLDSDDRLQHLFWAHCQSIELAKQYPLVFLLDCTYKTNRFQLPLLHIVGMAPTNQSFSIAFCLMANEQMSSYKWALKAFFDKLQLPPHHLPVMCTDRDLALLGVLRDEYPQLKHLLCMWHINKNVRARARALIQQNEELAARQQPNDIEQQRLAEQQQQMEQQQPTEQQGIEMQEGTDSQEPTAAIQAEFWQRWMSFVHANTEQAFDNARVTLQQWADVMPYRQQLVSYLDETWLVHREKFVTAWTRGILHLG